MFEPLRSRLGRPEIVSLMLIFGFHLSVSGGTADKKIQVLRSTDPIQMDGVLDERAPGGPGLRGLLTESNRGHSRRVRQPRTLR